MRPIATSLEGSTYTFMRDMSARMANFGQMSSDLQSAKSQISALHLTIGQLHMVRLCTCPASCGGAAEHSRKAAALHVCTLRLKASDSLLCA